MRLNWAAVVHGTVGLEHLQVEVLHVEWLLVLIKRHAANHVHHTHALVHIHLHILWILRKHVVAHRCNCHLVVWIDYVSFSNIDVSVGIGAIISIFTFPV
jgi:hypothetical protein